MIDHTTITEIREAAERGDYQTANLLLALYGVEQDTEWNEARLDKIEYDIKEALREVEGK